MLPTVGLSLLLSIVLCVHAVRTGQQLYWLMIILFLQPLGGLVYLVAIVLPSMARDPKARRFGQEARGLLDPSREYRQAKAACDHAPTVGNQMRLAKAASAQGRHQEAELLYREAAQGIHAADPALLMGRAMSLIELGRFDEALSILDALGETGDQARNPATVLALGRVYEGLGRMSEAELAYQWASGRIPGLEGLARYTAFLARTGRTEEAREALADIDGRITRANPVFRREAKAWRDLAARAVVDGS